MILRPWDPSRSSVTWVSVAENWVAVSASILASIQSEVPTMKKDSVGSSSDVNISVSPETASTENMAPPTTVYEKGTVISVLDASTYSAYTPASSSSVDASSKTLDSTYPATYPLASIAAFHCTDTFSSEGMLWPVTGWIRVGFLWNEVLYSQQARIAYWEQGIYSSSILFMG